MSFIHNRIGLVAVGVLMMLVLVGAGCGSRETTGADGKTSAVPGGATTTADDDAGAPTGTGASVTPDGGAITNWAEYRSESLGITIPYPEGWYVREDQGGDVTTMLIDPVALPPVGAGSDAPVRVTVTVTPLSLEDALATYEQATTSEVVFGDTRVAKVEYRSELGAVGSESSHREAYHWNIANRLYTVDGTKDDAVVVYIASALAAQEE